MCIKVHTIVIMQISGESLNPGNIWAFYKDGQRLRCYLQAKCPCNSLCVLMHICENVHICAHIHKSSKFGFNLTFFKAMCVK